MGEKNNVKRPPLSSRASRAILAALVMAAAIVLLVQNASVRNVSPANVDVRDGSQQRQHSNDDNGSSSNETITTITAASCEAMLDRFDASFDERRTIRQQRERQKLTVFNERKYFFDLYEPEAICFTDERFGYSDPNRQSLAKDLPEAYRVAKRFDSFGDGPKFVCGVDVIGNKNNNDNNSNNDDNCLVYSVGSYNDVAFEMTVHKFLGCEVHTFDPTIRDEDFVGNQYAIFHQWGLGIDGATSKADGMTWKGKSFETIIDELGHHNRTIDILKIDCEGCEWSTLPPLLESIAAGRTRVHQIQVEMHLAGLDTLDPRSQYLRNRLFEKLDEADMRIFHKERNHWGCDGYICLEYAFVSREFLRRANKAAVC